MKKKSAIIKLSIVGVLLILGVILSFCTFNFGFTRYKSFAGSIKLGLDLKGGVYAVYEATDTSMSDFDSAMEGTKTRLQNLIVSKGYSEATVVREGDTRLRVEVPDVDNPGAIFQIIGKPANVRFVLTTSSESESTILAKTDSIIVGKDHVSSASSGYYNGEYVVQLSFNATGQRLFAEATTNHTGEQIAIIIEEEGETPRIVSRANINEAIVGGNAIISGDFTSDSAKDLADQIMSGTFDVSLSLKESSTISATLGDRALTLGLIAGGVGLLLVMIFLCFVYRAYGGVASFCLMIYSVLMLFFLAVLPWVQLTLPGIAGIILSLGMAVDANIVITERIKYEYKNGKSIMASTHAGFKKATIAIIDSNVTTIIAAILLLIFGTGSIRGFALTLLVGIILSLFTSLFVTRKVCKWVIALNSTNPKLYNLKRGKGFEDVDADKTDAALQAKLDEEAAAKRAEKEAKKKAKKKKAEGELQNETV